MHICFASINYHKHQSGGGVGTYVQILGRTLVRLGHKVSVIAFDSDLEGSVTLDQGVEVYWVRSKEVYLHVSRIPIIGRILAHAIRELEYSEALFHQARKIHHLTPIDVIEGIETGGLRLSSLSPEVTTSIRLHGEQFTFDAMTPCYKIGLHIRLARWIQRKAIRNVDILTAPSSTHARLIESEVGLKDGTVQTIPNPMQMPNSDKLPPVNTEPSVTFLFVGRIERSKGILESLKAFPAILKEIPNAQLKIAGRFYPSLSENLIRNLIQELDITRHVTFLGHIPRTEMSGFYEKAQVVLAPSYYEAFGYVYLEALWFGRPLVVFDTGTARDFVQDKVNGIIVKCGDIAALAEGCIQAVKIPARPQNKRLAYRYDQVKIAMDLLDCYQNRIKKSERPGVIGFP